MAAPCPCAVRLTDVTVTLGRRAVLRGVTADFAAGRITAVVGPNGAGKSTLVRSLLGLVPSRGQIEIRGRELRSYSSRGLARAVSFIPQDTHLDFSFTARAVIMMGRYPHLRPLERERTVDHEQVARVIRTLGLEDLAERDITTLSVGERQLVLLGRALATGGGVLLGDEPVSALDVGRRLEVFELLRREATAGLAVVVVLHDLDLALRFADDVVLLAEGRVVAEGAPLAVLTSHELERAFGVRVEPLDGGKSLYVRPR